MGLDLFASAGCWRLVLFFFMGCLALGEARARVDPIGIAAGALASERGQGIKIALTEHQIRQLVTAEATVKDALLAKMVSDISAGLRRQNRSGQVVPEQLLRDRLIYLLTQGVAPEEWSDQIEYLVMTHDALRRHLSSLMDQRTGVGDRLIGANVALASGDLRAAEAQLDAELLDSDAASASATPQKRHAVDQELSSILAARGLMAALQRDGGAAKRLLLRSAGLHEAGSTQRAEVLLQAASASAADGSTQGMLEIARLIRSEAEVVLSRRPSDAAWRQAQWVAHLWIGMDALTHRDWSVAKQAFSYATRLAPDLSDSQPVHWSGIWVSHYVLAMLLQQEGAPGAQAHQAETLRLSREMTERRPDWPTAWLSRALSGALAVGEVTGQPVPESNLAHLQDAMSSLDRMAALGSNGAKALEARLHVLMKLRIVRHEQGDAAQARELSQRILAEMEELKRRHAGSTAVDLEGLLLSAKMHQAVFLRRMGTLEQAMPVLMEALALVERVEDGGWPMEALGVHSMLADTALSLGQLPLATQQWRLAVQKAELLVRKSGSGSRWDVQLWEGLYFLASALGKQSLVEEAVRSNEKAHEVAQRRAADERSYGEWHQRQFRTVMASADLHRQRREAMMGRYEAAARIPRAMYGSSGKAGRAAEDLWNVRTEMGDEWLRVGEQGLGRAAHGEALQIAEHALEVTASSDEWLARAASSHSHLAEIAGVSDAKRLELTHRQSAVDLSARRSPASRDSSDDEQEHWLRLYNLANAQQALDLDDKAFETMSVARDLARRFAAQLPDDKYWQEYLWFSESGIGDILLKRGEVAAAETAYEISAVAAEAMITKAQNLKTWWDFAAISLEAMAAIRKELGRDMDARRAELRASDYRLKLHEVQRETEVRAQVKSQISGVLEALDLKEEQAGELTKADLMSRLQVAIEQATEAIKGTDMDAAKSERLRRLRNALFVVRQLPDS